jgi:hypothetical protein
MNPITKRLPVHPAGLRGLMPVVAIQNHGDRKDTQPLFGVPRPPCRRAKFLDAQVLSCNRYRHHSASRFDDPAIDSSSRSVESPPEPTLLAIGINGSGRWYDRMPSGSTA